jgi:hypothetical protein
MWHLLISKRWHLLPSFCPRNPALNCSPFLVPGCGEVDVVREEAHPLAPVREGGVADGDVTVAPPTRDQEAWLTLAHLAWHIFLKTKENAV